MSDTDKPAAAKPAVVPARRGSALGMLALLLAVGLGVAGYYWTRFVAEPGSAALNARVASLAGERDALLRRLSDSEQRLQKLETGQSAIGTDIDTLRQTASGIEQRVKSLAANGGEQKLDWVLAESEYLILAASQRIALEHDAATAHAALVAADSRLQSAGESSLTPLREQLARDMQALAAVTQPDIEGWALKLAAQMSQVATLGTKPIAARGDAGESRSETKLGADHWRDVLRAMWNDLLGLVEVKDAKLPDDVLFDPQQRYALEQNLKLELSAARLALLERDTANFRAALDILQELLARYYDAEDGAVAALSAMLKEARGVELVPALPNASASLDAVRAARQALHASPP